MIFSSRRFFQKTNERIRLYYYDTSGRLVFVHFSEEIEGTKKTFQKLTDLYHNPYLWQSRQLWGFWTFWAEGAECAAHCHHIMGEKKRPLMQNALFFAIKTIEAAPEGGCAVVHHIISCTLRVSLCITWRACVHFRYLILLSQFR